MKLLPSTDSLINTTLACAPQAALIALTTGSLATAAITSIALATLFFATSNAVNFCTSQIIHSQIANVTYSFLISQTHSLRAHQPRPTSLLNQVVVRYFSALILSSIVCSVAAATFSSCFILPAGTSLLTTSVCVVLPFFLLQIAGQVQTDLLKVGEEDNFKFFLPSFKYLWKHHDSYDRLGVCDPSRTDKLVELLVVTLLYKSISNRNDLDRIQMAKDNASFALSFILRYFDCTMNPRSEFNVESSTAFEKLYTWNIEGGPEIHPHLNKLFS